MSSIKSPWHLIAPDRNPCSDMAVANQNQDQQFGVRLVQVQADMSRLRRALDLVLRASLPQGDEAASLASLDEPGLGTATIGDRRKT